MLITRALRASGFCTLILTCCVMGLPAFPQSGRDEPARQKYDSMRQRLDREVRSLMDEGKIPGLSLVIVDGDRTSILNYGYADREKESVVTDSTLFQLGSCSKAFTALAFLRLAGDRSIDLNRPVSDFLPWFHPQYKGKGAKISLLQVLHHTSGIPWQTIATIPVADDADALGRTVRNIAGIALRNLPGKKYEYATINYDILALVIQKLTGQPFEDYIRKEVFDPLQLDHTTIGKPSDSGRLAAGYKIGFFGARKYIAPVFKGNNAAGYVITDARDLSRWLRFQMGLADTGSSTPAIASSGLPAFASSGLSPFVSLYPLAQTSHQRDETVALHDMSSYAMGWEVALNGTREIHHGGLNPNYTSYIAFRPGMGVAVLANSNSAFTPVIGDRVIRMLAGDEKTKQYDPGDGNDKAFSLIAFIVFGYILAVIAFTVLVIRDIIRKKRRFQAPALAVAGRFAGSLLIILPFLYGLYILPTALAGFTWDSIFVWTPVSFAVMVVLMLVAIGLSYAVFFLSCCFPETNEFRRIAPRILLISILSGVANMIIITLVTSALDTSMRLRFLVFYYVLTGAVYLLGRRYVQVSLIRFSRSLIYELRIKLIDKIFSTSYQQFSLIDRGRIYTALNNDVDTIGESANTIVLLVTSCFTAAGAFLFLASIAFWAAMLTIALILLITVLYSLVSSSTNRYFEEARDTRNVFMRLVNGIIDGFKEISLHRNKKLEYKADVADSANKYREKTSIANIRFANAFMVGESLLIILLGAVVLGIPRLYPGIPDYVLMSFVIVLLYLIGPINAILSSIPSVMQLKTAWKRIHKFIKDIPANLDLAEVPPPIDVRVDSIRVEGVTFKYKSDSDREVFEVGPIDLEVRNGEVLFIIGGNGSGKTTLAKLLTGLYEPHEGTISINDKVQKGASLSEYFSAVFSPAYLFEKLYNVDVENKRAEIRRYLKLLDLDEKVEIKGNKYDTINLSGGQRKRMALLQCYLEDSPIYLFDEWAADQDPEYRNFFYRTLLPEMKMAGKIVIAITHDDHYFDVADKVLKMKQGKLEIYNHNLSKWKQPVH